MTRFTSLLLGSIALFLSGCSVSGSPRVTAERLNTPKMHIKVVERTRDPFRGLPAKRIYHFTVPVRSIVRADAIQDYETFYKGSDGTTHEFKEPIAGFVRFPDLTTLQQIEICLIGGAEGARHSWFPLSINGTHRIASHP
jgi:hypothetical protein